MPIVQRERCGAQAGLDAAVSRRVLLRAPIEVELHLKGSHGGERGGRFEQPLEDLVLAALAIQLHHVHARKLAQRHGRVDNLGGRVARCAAELVGGGGLRSRKARGVIGFAEAKGVYTQPLVAARHEAPHALLQLLAVHGHRLKRVHSDGGGCTPKEVDEVDANVRANIHEHLATSKMRRVAQSSHAVGAGPLPRLPMRAAQPQPSIAPMLKVCGRQIERAARPPRGGGGARTVLKTLKRVGVCEGSGIGGCGEGQHESVARPIASRAGAWRRVDGPRGLAAKRSPAMPRKGRRDCRKSQSKNNPMNLRVEALQKEIRKTKKTGTTSAAAPAEPASSLTPTAAAFLSQMRADAASNVSKIREDVDATVKSNDSSSKAKEAT